MIDLHTHTTASDGRCSPEELVARASAAGVTVLSVTDHDTVEGCAAAAAACAASSIEFVRGIEVTAILDERDVHVLGYFIDVDDLAFLAFLAGQRVKRVDRIRQIVARLAAEGVMLDADAVLKPGLDNPRKAAGRPWVARALVAAGYAADTRDAFERYLVPGRPSFVPRDGASPAEVFARIHAAGDLASLAHPALLKRDDLIPGFAAAKVDAIEVYHSAHTEDDAARYLALAGRLGLATTGGSDYHADESHGPGGPGSVVLPRDAFDRLSSLRRPSAPPVY